MELDGHLDPEFCEEIIKQFEEDPNKEMGHTGGGFNPNYKSSIDLGIHRYRSWNPITEKLNILVNEGKQRYMDWLHVMLPWKDSSLERSKHNGFQIQKSGKYDWHDDSNTEEDGERVFTFIWYLNTIDEGGETDLIYKKVKPRVGKLLIFPSTWTYVHRGLPAENKYIITGWFYRGTQRNQS